MANLLIVNNPKSLLTSKDETTINITIHHLRDCILGFSGRHDQVQEQGRLMWINLIY